MYNFSRMGRLKEKSLLSLMILVFGGMVSFTTAATYVEENSVIKLPVTFYCYHPDSSNPDFGATSFHKWDLNTSDIWRQVWSPIPGMIKPVLSATTKKPEVAAYEDFSTVSVDNITVFETDANKQAAYDLYANVSKWFAPWDGQGCSFTTAGATPVTIQNDTCLKNVVNENYLTLYKGNGYYYRRGFRAALHHLEMMDTTRLPGRVGFPGDSANWEIGTAMELHNRFTYKAGDMITVGGSGDVWLFINNQLVADMGGWKWGCSRTVDLSTLSLVEGETYDLDFFFTVRGRWMYYSLLFESNLTWETFTPGLEIVNMDYHTNFGVMDGRNYPVGVPPDTTTAVVNQYGSIASKGITFDVGKNITIPAETKRSVIEVYDAQGKVMQRTALGTARNLNSVQLPKGVFFVKVVCFDDAGKNIATIVDKVLVTR